MSLFLALIVGIIVGGGAGFLLSENLDLLVLNILMGIAGAILGGAGYALLTSTFSVFFSWPDLLCTIIGALLAVLIFDGLHKVVPKRAAKQTDVDKDPVVED